MIAVMNQKHTLPKYLMTFFSIKILYRFWIRRFRFRLYNINNSSNIRKLKKLVFNPGAEIDGVPLIVGKRLAIFDDEMVPDYDYKIAAASMYNDSISCYVFSCIEKSGAGDYPILKSLSTCLIVKHSTLFTVNTGISTAVYYSISMLP